MGKHEKWKNADQGIDRGFLELTAIAQEEFMMLQTVSQAQTPSWPECLDRYSTQALAIFRLLSIAEDRVEDVYSFAIHSLRSHTIGIFFEACI